MARYIMRLWPVIPGRDPAVDAVRNALSGKLHQDKGRFLKSVDFEAFEGRGSVQTTTSQLQAMKFASPAEAMTLWRTQSKTVPVRPDGKPNRPLTAYTVDFVRIQNGE